MKAAVILFVLAATTGTAAARGHHAHGHSSHHHHGGIRGHTRHKCNETDPVMGYQRCSRFGSWGSLARMPALTLEAGVLFHRFRETDLVDPSEGPVAARVLSPTPSNLTASGVQFRLSLSPFGPLYVAAESDWGLVSATEIRDASGAAYEPGVGAYFAARGVLGVRSRATSSTTAGVEVAGGWRMVTWGTPTASTGTIGAAGPDVQLRARGEYWMSPWLTLNAAVGTSVLARGDWMATLSLAIHSRAFDARW